MFSITLHAALACSCATVASPIEALPGAEYAFVGVVVRRTAAWPWQRHDQVDMNVLHPMLGVDGEQTLRLSDGTGHGDCGLAAQPGERFLVVGSDGALGGLCGPSRRLLGPDWTMEPDWERLSMQAAGLPPRTSNGRYRAPSAGTWTWLWLLLAVGLSGATVARRQTT